MSQKSSKCLDVLSPKDDISSQYLAQNSLSPDSDISSSYTSFSHHKSIYWYHKEYSDYERQAAVEGCVADTMTVVEHGEDAVEGADETGR
jgi:hypothetical protein